MEIPSPCYTDPQRGIAFFDQIFIETDSITNPSIERVLPILEEEQIFMCRQMNHLLKKDQLVLDVGTGSGVFAIWAAKRGCKVLAIDISPRSLMFAKQNATRNGIKVHKQPQELQSGSICLLEIRFDDQFENILKTQYCFNELFDMVILAPPYNLTCPGLYPALHADAGEDGQEAFNEQIKAVPNLLKNGGYCVGNQMTTLIDGEIQAFREIQASFVKDYQLSYARIINEDISTKDFLQAQYEGFFAEKVDCCEFKNDVESIDSVTSKSVFNYIEKVSRQFEKLVFLYYEIKYAKDDSLSNPQIYEIPQSSTIIHHKTWEDRKWLHRNIVEYAIHRGFLSTPSLLLGDFPSHFTSNNSVKCDSIGASWMLPTMSPKSKEKLRIDWSKSRLHAVDKFLQWKKFQQGGEHLFDTLIVNVAAIHRNIEGYRGIGEECKLWLFGDNKDLKSYAIDLLKEWHKNTVTQQKACTAPFLHPSFTGLIGLSNLSDWGNICISDPNSNPDIDFLEYSRKFEIENPTDNFYDNLDDGNYYLQSTLAELYVRDPIDYYNSLSGERLFLLEREPYKSKIANFNSRQKEIIQKGVIHALESSDEAVIALLQNFLRDDLIACNNSMHSRINERFRMHAYNCEENFKNSSLIGIPLIFQRKQDAQISDLPDFYRGGFWIYGSTSKDWTKEHEDYLLNLSRFVWLQYMDEYTLDSVNASAGIKGAEFAHHAAGLVAGISDDSENTLTESSIGKLWHLSKLTELFGTAPMSPLIDITGKGQLLERFEQDDDIEVLKYLIDLSLEHTLYKLANEQNDPEIGKIYLELNNMKENKEDWKDHLLKLLRFSYPDSNSIPERFVRALGFSLFFHHVFFQAAYHAVKAYVTQGKMPPFLWIKCDKNKITVGNKTYDNNANITISMKDKMLYKDLDSRLGKIFTHDISQKDIDSIEVTIIFNSIV